MSRLSAKGVVTSTWNPGSILDGDEAATDITVNGAALGDFVLISGDVDAADLQLTGTVTAANTVTAVYSNSTGGAVDLASHNIRVAVIAQDVAFG